MGAQQPASPQKTTVEVLGLAGAGGNPSTGRTVVFGHLSARDGVDELPISSRGLDRFGGGKFCRFRPGVVCRGRAEPGDWDENEYARIAIAFKSGDQAISVNGGNQVTATVSSGYPSSNITKMWIGSAGASGSGQFNGWISKVLYYPKQLSDAQLNTLTAN